MIKAQKSQDKKLFDEFVSELKKEIDVIPVVKKDNIPFTEEVALVLTGLKIEVEKIINTLAEKYKKELK